METVKIKQLLYEWKRVYVSQEGLLKCKTATYTQIVLPEKYKEMVHKYLHCEMGHLGVEQSFLQLKFEIVTSRKNLQSKACVSCTCNSTIRDSLYRLSPPWKKRGMNIFQWLLITSLSLHKPTQTRQKKEAEKNLNDLALKFAFPAKTNHDQDREFENQFSDSCKNTLTL